MKYGFFFALMSVAIPSVLLAQSPTPGYYVIYGNSDGSPVDVNIDSDIKIEVWAATPAIGSGYEDLDSNGVVDSIYYIHSPLASNDSAVATRNDGEFFVPLSVWDDISYYSPIPDTMPGYTSQSIIGYCCMIGPDENMLSTNGDTAHIATFFMHAVSDSSLISELICPFKEGYHDVYGGQEWTTSVVLVYPEQTFSCLNFVEYHPGDANGTGDVNGLDVIYLVGYLKGDNPPPDPIFAGDANGDCQTNGLDVIYLVSYFKGGPEPFLGSCH